MEHRPPEDQSEADTIVIYVSTRALCLMVLCAVTLVVSLATMAMSSRTYGWRGAGDELLDAVEEYWLSRVGLAPAESAGPAPAESAGIDSVEFTSGDGESEEWFFETCDELRTIQHHVAVGLIPPEMSTVIGVPVPDPLWAEMLFTDTVGNLVESYRWLPRLPARTADIRRPAWQYARVLFCAWVYGFGQRPIAGI